MHFSSPEPDHGRGDESAPSSSGADPDRVARALLSYLAGSAGDALMAMQTLMPPIDVLASCIQSGTLPADPSGHLREIRLQGLTAALGRWRSQLADLRADGGIADAHRAGIRLICPGDSEWPPALDDLGAARPCALWARGAGDLRACSHPAVAVIGTRAATAYGVHVATEITADLAACGLTIISGAAYGIDAAAHQAALAVAGLTVAVLACGPDISYPREHAELLEQITAHGLIVSEYPPGPGSLPRPQPDHRRPQRCTSRSPPVPTPHGRARTSHLPSLGWLPRAHHLRHCHLRYLRH